MNSNAVYLWVWTTTLSLLLATAFGGDLFYHMEDAFAEETLVSACRFGEKVLFCRLGNLHKSDFEMLDLCLCTHLIFDEENADWSVSVKHSHQQLVTLLSSPLVQLTKHGMTAFLDKVQAGDFDGMDVTIGDEAGQPESLNVLKDLGKRLADAQPSRKLLSLTFMYEVPTPSFLEQLSTIDVTSFTFFPDYNRTSDQQRESLNDILKLTIPSEKMLYGIKIGNFRKSPNDFHTFPQICQEIESENSEETSSSRKKNNRNLMENLQNEIRHASQIKMAGVHIWSLAEDDAGGNCGVGPFPILHSLRKTLNPTPETFGKFADLDVLLSTGESQELQKFIRDPNVTPEEMEKLPCERVGFYRHPSDCTKFYHCSEYRDTKFDHSGPYAGFLYKCPPGLVYDERRSSCIWPSWSDPCKGSGELLPVPEKKFSCLTPGFHVDPEDCRWFYYCSDLGDGRLEAFEFLCPSGLLGFDERSMLCNWKWTVPICVKKSHAESSSVTEAGNQIRKPKELNLEGVSFASHLTTRFPSDRTWTTTHAVNGKPVSPRPRDIHVPTHSQQQQQNSVTTETTPITPDGLLMNHVEPKNTSLRGNRFVDEKQNLTERKYGTAVWRRSWINGNTVDARSIPSRFNKTDDDLREKGIEIHTPKAKSNQDSNQNDLDTHARRTIVPEDVREPETFFRGRVRKISLDRQMNQTMKLQYKNENTKLLDQERNTETKSQTKDIKEKNILLDEVFRDDVEFPRIQDRKNTPFINVRCSKLENGDASTLGCTSEVSLTIQIGRQKDSSRYILRDDQITRTAYQESRDILHLKTPREGNSTDNSDYKIKRTNSSPLLASPENESSTLQQKRNKSHTAQDLETSSTKTLTETNTASILKIEPNTESPLFNFTRNSKIKTGAVNENTSAYLEHKTQKSIDRNQTRTEKQDITEKTKSMLIHFYPQGVLLNIDLKHVNEIPPQILLEVDNMLKKYMDEGEIDLGLLERTLDASTEKVAEKEDKSKSEEVMQMIKAIQNIINTTREREYTATETTGDDNYLETDYINFTNPQKNTSDSNVSFVDAGTDRSPEDPRLKIHMTNDKIRNPDSSPSIPQNVSDPKPFGRRRLIRKYKYPSIREQLEKQIQHRGSQEVTHKDASSSDFDDKTSMSLTYRYPLSRNETPPGILGIRYRDERTNSLTPETEASPVMTPVLPYAPNGDNIHKHSSTNQREDNSVLRPPTIQHGTTPTWEGRRKTSYTGPGIPTFSNSNIAKAEKNDSERLKEDLKTTHRALEIYDGLSDDQKVLHRVQVNSDHRFQSLRYGDRTEAQVNRRTFQKVSYAHLSENFFLLGKNTNALPTNFDEANLNYNLRESVRESPIFESYISEDHHENNARKVGASPDSQGADADNKRSMNTSLLQRNRTASFLNEWDVLDGNTLQRGKKKKIKVLIRRPVDGSESTSRRERLPMNNDRNTDDIRQKISKNVLKALKDRFSAKDAIDLQIHYQGNVWNIPFVNEKSKASLSPTVCTRSGLFQHPRDCNMFYECFWDKWLQTFTLHVFSCPVRLVYDENVRGCGRPSIQSSCSTFTE